MTKLKGISPKKIEPTKPKVLLYGKPGVGKTFGALGFPNLYYIDSEHGAVRDQYIDKLEKSGGTYFGKDHGSQDFKSVVDEVKTLATIKHDRKTLVIDSISKLFNVVMGNEAERLGDKDQFGASKKPAVTLTRQLINWVDKMDMAVLLVAHEKAVWSDTKQTGTTFDAWDKLEYELDLVLNIVKMGETRKAFVKKSRLSQFPEGSSFDWSYENFAALYGKNIIETEAKPVILATQEQIVEVKKLLETIKLTDSTKDKWIAENKDNLSEIEAEKVDGIIKHLKEKIAPSSDDKDKPPFLQEKK